MNGTELILAVFLVVAVAGLIYKEWKLKKAIELIEEYEDLSKEAVDALNAADAKNKLITADMKARVEDIKKIPAIACMKDEQVAMLAELLASHLRDLFPERKEFIN